jgi:hypothetical protein
LALEEAVDPRSVEVLAVEEEHLNDSSTNPQEEAAVELVILHSPLAVSAVAAVPP